MNSNDEQKQDTIILQNEKNAKKSFFSSDDSIKPILAYFIFTTKYILKKKSTIFLPILNFILIMFLSLTPIFFMDSESSQSYKQQIFSIFIPLISSFSISLTVVFSTTKALNLFKDISNEGMEILIVSKPIKRSQIIFVRFMYFLFLGIFVCLINYFAVFIGLAIAGNVLPINFSIFNYVTIYFFSMLMAYVLFGSISIMLSLRFSTKLVSSLSLGILGVGLILSQVTPQIIFFVERKYESKIEEHNSNVSDPNLTVNLAYYVTTEGNIIIYNASKNIEDPLTENDKQVIMNAFKSKDDLSWLINLNNFVNPVAGITKVASIRPTFANDIINFTEFNADLIDGPIVNNLWENNNYFLTPFSFNEYSHIELNLAITLPGATTESKQNVIFDFAQSRPILQENVNQDQLARIFDNILKMELSNTTTTRELIIKESESIFQTSIDIIIQQIKDLEKRSMIQLRSEQEGIIDIRKINEVDFKNQLITFIFYLYGLDKLNGNIDKFQNREIFIDSIVSNSKNNNFLNYSFGLAGQSSKIFFSAPQDKKFEAFISRGEKVSAEIIATTWSSVILLILVGTIIIYYRKDFT